MAFVISKVMPHSAHSSVARPRVLGETVLVGPFRFQTVVRLETVTVTVTESCTSNPHRELAQAEFIALVKSKLGKKVAAVAAWRPNTPNTPNTTELEKKVAELEKKLAAMTSKK